jgi:DNA-binding CsgD family transcriptional regulator
VESGVVGRHAELAEVDTLLAEAGERFAALAIEGEPGIGKTVLWREARRRAETGFTVLWCRPAEPEAKFSLAGVSDLLSPVPEREYKGLPEPQREALEVALLRVSPGERSPDHRAIGAGFLTLIRRLAASRPVLLAVDDAQWLDGPSRRVLEFAIRRLEAEHVGFLYCARGPAADRRFATLASSDRVRHLSLGALSLAALGRILADHLGQRLPRPVLVRVSQASAGNPFYALEIGRLLLESAVPRGAGSDLPVPDDLRVLTVRRIARLPNRAREALALAAVVSAPRAKMFAPGELQPATDAGIVTSDESGAIEFSHPLFAAAVLSTVDPARRRDLHRRAAELLTDPEQRVRHLALAREEPDAVLARQLDDASEVAASRGALDSAAELSELAAGRTPRMDDAPRVGRLLVALRCHLEAGDLSRAERLAEIVVTQAPTDGLRARGMQAAAQLAARRSNFVAARELGTEAAGLAAGDPMLQAAVQLDLVYCAISLGDLPSAAVHAATAVEHAEAAGASSMLADALAVMTVAQFLGGGGLNQERRGRALALEDPAQPRAFIMRPSVIDGMLALWSGDLGHARHALGRVRDETLERGREGDLPLMALYLVWEAVWRGDLAEADRLAGQSREAADLLQDPTVTGLALTAAAIVHAHDGHTALARSESREALRLFEALQWRTGMVWPCWALGLAELAEGDPAAVDTVLAPVTEQMVSLGLGDPVMAMFVPDEVEALISLGDLQRAERYLTPFERRADELDRAWARAAAGRARGALLAAYGDGQGAQRALQNALGEHERTCFPLERARTLLVAGRVLRRHKQRGRAREMLEEAENVFGRLGASLWQAQARAELERVGHPTRARDELTATERQLAELAATGLSNREVAERSFVAVKTVEANLSRVYRKLGLRSRVELANHFAAAPVEPPERERRD